MEVLSTSAWFNPWAVNPVPHGTPAESIYISGIDTMQIAALWGSWPHWAANAYIPRGSSTMVPVVIPPFVDRALPVVMAAGEGQVIFNTNEAYITLESEDSEAIQFAQYQTADSGTKLEVSAIGSNQVDWIDVQATSTVHVYALGFIFSRSAHNLLDGT